MHGMVTRDRNKGTDTMLKAKSASTRAPRGSKTVSQAFFTALEDVPEASRAVVSKAAHAMIRDELKAMREKAKVAAAKIKARAPVKAKRIAKKNGKVGAVKRATPNKPVVPKPPEAEATT
jgi:hypothetical protein